MGAHTHVRYLFVLVLILVTSLVLAACGSDATATPLPLATATPVPAPTATLAPGAPVPTPTSLPTATPTPSFDAEAYFAGKTVKIVVGFAPGGGYDTFSRLVARFAGKYFPGNPRFIVQNLPGAGSRRALQFTMESDPDGFTTHAIHSSIAHAALRDEELPGFDFERIGILGGVDCALESETQSLYVPRSVATTWDEVVAKGIKLTSGMTQPDESGGTVPRFMEMLGAPIKNIGNQ